MLVDINGLAELLTAEAYLEYQQQPFPFRNELVFVNLTERLVDEPDYEVFVPLTYYKQEAHMGAKNDNLKVDPYKWYISNKGRVVNLRNSKKPEWIEPTINSSDYPEVQVRLGKNKVEHIILSRALACAFLPLPPELGTKHPKELQVIHLDGDKGNYALGNLQWQLPPKAGDGAEEPAGTGIVGVLV
jgi:hypothetical protein